MIFIYTACKGKEEAKKIAKYLLDKKLVACVNMFPITSMYSWGGKLAEEDEFVLLLKTKKENYSAVKEEIEKIHSYDVPCIAKLDVKFNEKYEKWLFGELK